MEVASNVLPAMAMNNKRLCATCDFRRTGGYFSAPVDSDEAGAGRRSTSARALDCSMPRQCQRAVRIRKDELLRGRPRFYISV